MSQKDPKSSQQTTTTQGVTGSSDPSPKKAWHEPKLKFVEPKLTTHGGIKEVTGQFFGAFSAS